jgi:CheY-like chemotaxis protein
MKEQREILWVDDEIELLRSHIIFLEQRQYRVTPVSNGDDAVSMLKEHNFDLVLLDQMMPGRDGLSTLVEIKEIDPNVPVVMVTKSEAEELMDHAIVRQVDDYLVKPLNPHQIISVCKRILDAQDIQEKQLGEVYVAEMNRLKRSPAVDWRGWVEIHQKLSDWDIRLERFRDMGIQSLQEEARQEANASFGRFVTDRYRDWIEGGDAPLLSVQLIRDRILPELERSEQVIFVVLDCMRLDQWLAIEPLIRDYYDLTKGFYYSILPTATPYARNGIFSGLFPSEIARAFPQYWIEQHEEGSKNRFEGELLEAHLARLRLRSSQIHRYIKILSANDVQAMRRRMDVLFSQPLTVIVVNFMDILAHARSESEVLQEIAPDESGFRSLTRTWFQHSVLFEVLKVLAHRPCTVVLTTDHGSICGRRATKVFGGREISRNLRYKFGHNLRCDQRHALYIRNPQEYKLPRESATKRYVIAKEDYYFVYPTHYHEYRRQYRDTFQHGGISLEEMVLPIAVLHPKLIS